MCNANRLTPKMDGFAYDIANKTYDFDWQAYSAHYNTKNWSKNAIYVEACKLRSHPKVLLRIKELEDKIREEEKLTLDDIIIKLSKRSEVDIRGLLNDDGTFKKISELTEDQAIFISGFKVSEIWGRGDEAGIQIGRIVDVKIESFKDIMDMLIRHHGGYAKDKDTGSNNLDAIKEIIESVKKI